MLKHILRNIDGFTLKELVGDTIIQGIKTMTSSESEGDLAAIVIDKYGNLILKEKLIRRAIINSLDKEKQESLHKIVSNPAGKNKSVYLFLKEYFIDKSFNEVKSEQLVDFLGLDKKYVIRKVLDNRVPFEELRGNPEDIKLKPYLHPFQKRVKDAVSKNLNRRSRKFMVQMPTGSGKTYTALESVVDMLRTPNYNRYIIWIVDSNELAEQAYQSFKNLWNLKGDHSINIFRLFNKFISDFDKFEGGVVFASFDIVYSIIKKEKDKRSKSLEHLSSHTDLLIVDEAHTSVAETHQECIDFLTRNVESHLVGLTATPGRNVFDETRELKRIYSGLIVDIKDRDDESIQDAIDYLQKHKYLAKLETVVLETGIEIKEKNENLMLKQLASDSSRNEKIMDQIKLANENQEATLIFACTLDHVIALSILCNKMKIESEFIVGAVSQSERIKIIESFQNRDFNILINLDILATGIDIPLLNKIIITRPLNTKILYSQILGRALRGPKNGGNEVNTIINIEDNVINFPTAQLVYNWFRFNW